MAAVLRWGLRRWEWIWLITSSWPWARSKLSSERYLKRKGKWPRAPSSLANLMITRSEGQHLLSSCRLGTRVKITTRKTKSSIGRWAMLWIILNSQPAWLLLGDAHLIKEVQHHCTTGVWVSNGLAPLSQIKVPLGEIRPCKLWSWAQQIFKLKDHSLQKL